MMVANISLAPAFKKLISEWRRPFSNDDIVWVEKSLIDENYKFNELHSIGARIWDCKQLTSIDSWLFQFLIKNKYIKRWKNSLTIWSNVYKDNTPEYRVAEASLQSNEEISSWLVERFLDWLPGFYVLDRRQWQSKN